NADRGPVDRAGQDHARTADAGGVVFSFTRQGDGVAASVERAVESHVAANDGDFFATGVGADDGYVAATDGDIFTCGLKNKTCHVGQSSKNSELCDTSGASGRIGDRSDELEEVVAESSLCSGLVQDETFVTGQ